MADYATAENQTAAKSDPQQKAASQAPVVTTEQPEAIQMLPDAAAATAEKIHSAAAEGTSGSGSELPHLGAIQKSFGRYDVSQVQAYTGSNAANASKAMGAEAYTTGNKVGFANTSPSLHTAAHEAAHVVQQQAGVQLSSGIGKVGDTYERHADAVADMVVQGKSVESLLQRFAGNGTHSRLNNAVSMLPAKPTQMMPVQFKVTLTTAPAAMSVNTYDKATYNVRNIAATRPKILAEVKDRLAKRQGFYPLGANRNNPAGNDIRHVVPYQVTINHIQNAIDTKNSVTAYIAQLDGDAQNVKNIITDHGEANDNATTIANYNKAKAKVSGLATTPDPAAPAAGNAHYKRSELETFTDEYIRFASLNTQNLFYGVPKATAVNDDPHAAGVIAKRGKKNKPAFRPNDIKGMIDDYVAANNAVLSTAIPAAPLPKPAWGGAAGTAWIGGDYTQIKNLVNNDGQWGGLGVPEQTAINKLTGGSAAEKEAALTTIWTAKALDPSKFGIQGT